MNRNIQALCDISKKPRRTIIGLMSGTSLDGLDIALCKMSGGQKNETEKLQVKLLNFETVEYSDKVKYEIRSVFAKSQVDLQHLCLLNAWIGTLHGEMINETLRKWGVSPEEVDAIASHGQTVFHAPKSFHKIGKFPNATLQIGDGDHVAVKTGIITVSDFRQKHIAAGGEGAPLALYGDYLLFSDKNETRILLNIGGIANFTYLPATAHGLDLDAFDASCPIATDAGPGNTLIDTCARKFYNREYDENGNIARSGQVQEALLTQLKKHPFFGEPFPKSTGQELFNMENVQRCQLESNTTQASPPDLIATLTRFSAETIADAISICTAGVQQIRMCIYTSGGGRHNSTLMQHLQVLLAHRCSFADMSGLGIPGDAKEAVLFAVLADQTVCGDSQQMKALEKSGLPTVSMGKISFPN